MISVVMLVGRIFLQLVASAVMGQSTRKSFMICHLDITSFTVVHLVSSLIRFFEM